jgi:hypothetical protein
VFKKGHRIRIDISNADSAALDEPWTHHYGTRMGSDTYHHDQAGPSRLMLPIPPADAWIIVAASEKTRKELETDRACAVCLQQADPANALIVVFPVTWRRLTRFQATGWVDGHRRIG